ncbi:MAG: DUF1127 domain-containing protein [Aestuariivirgaceae bacterium]
MTVTTLSRAVRAPANQPTWITNMITQRVRAFRQRWHERRAMGELRVLNNHTLKDIGVHRSEISSIVCVNQTDRRKRHAGH